MLKQKLSIRQISLCNLNYIAFLNRIELVQNPDPSVGVMSLHPAGLLFFLIPLSWSCPPLPPPSAPPSLCSHGSQRDL